MPNLAEIIAAAQAKLATLPARAVPQQPLRFAPAPVASMPVARATSAAQPAQTFARLPVARTYRAALTVPYSAPLAMLADAHPAGFTIADMLAAGIAKPAPVALRDAPMPQPYAVPSRTKPSSPKRDGAGPLTIARLIHIGDSATGDSLFTIA